MHLIMPLQVCICRPQRQYHIINFSRRKFRGQQGSHYRHVTVSHSNKVAGFSVTKQHLLRKDVIHCQKQNLHGKKGNWEQFLRATVPNSTTDPRHHDWKFGTGHRLRANLVCEICITKRAMQELIGLCIVNTAGSTVLKMLVRPGGVVVDWRTPVTGATSETMQGVTYSWKDAQKAVQLLLKGNVLLVGHALHNDLKTLHLDPTAFIDTALLFLYNVGAVHDCEQDAAATMQLVNHALQNGIPTDLQAPPIKVPESDPRFVYVQSVPAYIKSSDLWELFDDCGYAPLDLRRKLERGTGRMEFAHAEDAAEAFKQLPAVQEVDSLGWEEKLVPLKAGQCKGSMIKFWKFPLLAS